jgi:hypothetical protein
MFLAGLHWRQLHQSIRLYSRNPRLVVVVDGEIGRMVIKQTKAETMGHTS